MWSKSLNESFSALTTSLRQSLPLNPTFDSQQNLISDDISRQLSVECDLLRRECQRLKARLDGHSPVDPQVGDESDVPDDGSDDTRTTVAAMPDVTAAAERVMALEDELRKVEADRSHWRTLCLQQQTKHDDKRDDKRDDASDDKPDDEPNDDVLQLKQELQLLDQIHAQELNKLVQIKNTLEQRLAQVARGEPEGEDGQRAQDRQLLETRIHDKEADVQRITEECERKSEEIQRLTQKVDELMVRVVVPDDTTVQRLNEELARLKRHLVEVEDNYCRELLTAEQTIRQLREEKEALEATAGRLKEQHFEEEIRNLKTEREIARNQVSALEDKNAEYSASVNNLQVVVEQLQRENERKIQVLKRDFDSKLLNERKISEQLESRVRQLEQRIQDTTEALGAAERLSMSLDAKEATISSLRSSVELKEQQMADLRLETNRMKDSFDGTVDKQVAKSLFLALMTSSEENRRKEVQKLISRFLDFNSEEMSKTGLQKTTKDESLSARFVLFLHNESTPPPITATPTPAALSGLSRSLIADSQRTNPFLATVPTSTSSSRRSSVAMTTDNPLLQELNESFASLLTSPKNQ